MYIASLVLGLLSLLLSWIPVFNIILSLVALIVSIVAVARKRKDKNGKGMGVAGVILSSVSIIISIVFCIVIVVLVANIPSFLETVITELKQEFDINEFTGYIEAETLLQSKYAQVVIKNKDRAYTGYINNITEEYTEMLHGVEVDEYYENYLESNGYDCDINVDIFGEPNIEY